MMRAPGWLSRARPDGFVLALLATIALASVLPARGGAAPVASFAADAAIVLIFFLNGAKLSREAFLAGATHWQLHLLVLVVSFVFFPLVGFALASLPFVPADLRSGLIFMAITPSTIQSSVVYVAIAGGSFAAAVCAAALSNIVGVFVTPVLVALLIGVHSAGGSGMDAIMSVVLQLLLPFVAGHLLRPFMAGFLERWQRPVKLADRGGLLLVVYAAFSASVAAGLWQRTGPGELALVAVLVTLALGLGLWVTLVAGRVLKFTREDVITIRFCGTMKSLAAGLPMAKVIFPASQVGAIIMPLLAYHLIEMIVCAVIARRYADEGRKLVAAAAPAQSD